MKIPVLYTTLRAFEYVLLEDVRSISIDKFKPFRKMLIESEKKMYELGYVLNPDNTVAAYQYEDMSAEEYDTEFEKVLQECTDLFHIEGDLLVLNDGVTNVDISKKKGEMHLHELSSYNTDAMRFLGITKMLDFIDRATQIEKETESLYQELAHQANDKSIQKHIARNLIIRKSVLNICQKNGWDFLFSQTSGSFHDDISNFDRLFTTVDKAYFQNNPFFELPGDLDECLSNQMISLLFDDRSVAALRLYETCLYEFLSSKYGFFQNIAEYEAWLENPNVPFPDDIDDESFHEEEEYEDEKTPLQTGDIVEFHGDIDLLEHLFYLVYLKKINELLESSPSEALFFLKARLLYLLDQPEYALFQEKNIDSVIDRISMVCSFEEEDIEDYSYIAYFFTDELFHKTSEDEHTQTKLIYICTYYALTDDPEIREILDQYKSHPKYQEYLSFITDMPFGAPKLKLQ